MGAVRTLTAPCTVVGAGPNAFAAIDEHEALGLVVAYSTAAADVDRDRDGGGDGAWRAVHLGLEEAAVVAVRCLTVADLAVWRDCDVVDEHAGYEPDGARSRRGNKSAAGHQQTVDQTVMFEMEAAALGGC